LGSRYGPLGEPAVEIPRLGSGLAMCLEVGPRVILSSNEFHDHPRVSEVSDVGQIARGGRAPGLVAPGDEEDRRARE
jgi:hypothetical protein